jgi:hypothetical protein
VRTRPVLVVDVVVKVLLVALLGHALLNPDLLQYQGNAMAGRAITFPPAALLIPAIWLFRFSRRRYPALIDLLVTTPVPDRCRRQRPQPVRHDRLVGRRQSFRVLGDGDRRHRGGLRLGIHVTPFSG